MEPWIIGALECIAEMESIHIQNTSSMGQWPTMRNTTLICGRKEAEIDYGRRIRENMAWEVGLRILAFFWFLKEKWKDKLKWMVGKIILWKSVQFSTNKTNWTKNQNFYKCITEPTQLSQKTEPIELNQFSFSVHPKAAQPLF